MEYIPRLPPAWRNSIPVMPRPLPKGRGVKKNFKTLLIYCQVIRVSFLL
jgi:hypothetical protein